MSGLLILIDEVAAIAKVAASSIDDIAYAAAKAGGKTAGVVIDDAAVTPKYVQGFHPDRELPIIWKIARGSLLNKIVILLPAAIALNEFLPSAITPLLMCGGTYLCFEGAEKILHKVLPHGDDHAKHEGEHHEEEATPETAASLEEKKVKGAVKTDFILSAEIMAISLSNIPESTLWVETAALGLVGIAVTVAVYGSVAVIIKMDDVGMHLAAREGAAIRAIGRALVVGMPYLLTTLSVVGTAAMLWVGGSIMVHGLHNLGLHHPYKEIHDLAEWAAHAVPVGSGFVEWAVTAGCDGVLGLIYGSLVALLITFVVAPLWKKVRSGAKK